MNSPSCEQKKKGDTRRALITGPSMQANRLKSQFTGFFVNLQSIKKTRFRTFQSSLITSATLNMIYLGFGNTKDYFDSAKRRPLYIFSRQQGTCSAWSGAPEDAAISPHLLCGVKC